MLHFRSLIVALASVLTLAAGAQSRKEQIAELGERVDSLRTALGASMAHLRQVEAEQARWQEKAMGLQAALDDSTQELRAVRRVLDWMELRVDSFSQRLEVLEMQLSESNLLVKHWLNPSVSYGEVNDIDGNVYATVQIGHRMWMAENLRTTRYRNGDALAELSLSAHGPTEGGWFWEEHHPLFRVEQGRTYNGYAVFDGRQLCPMGWHIPTYEEWNEALEVIGFGKELFSSYCWVAAGMNDIVASTVNASGFSAVPMITGDHLDDCTGGWWTASVLDAHPVQVELSILAYERMSLEEDPIEGLEHEELQVNWADLLPVRCVKD